MPIEYTRPGDARAQTTGAAVSLSKVALTKSAPSVSLSKQGAATGTLRVNLNWNARPITTQPAGGFFKRMMASAAADVDLDLGCLYEFTDGSSGVVQALGDMFESTCGLTRDPIIRLDGDDRSGANDAGENLLINLSYRQYIRRVLVFAFIYDGVPNWAAADGVVTLFPVAGPQIEVRLDEPDPESPTCAIAMIESDGNDLQVRREVRYIRGNQLDLDRAYGWGLKWGAPARK
jgi:tellurite resistance protein TerA